MSGRNFWFNFSWKRCLSGENVFPSWLKAAAIWVSASPPTPRPSPRPPAAPLIQDPGQLPAGSPALCWEGQSCFLPEVRFPEAELQDLTGEPVAQGSQPGGTSPATREDGPTLPVPASEVMPAESHNGDLLSLIVMPLQSKGSTG